LDCAALKTRADKELALAEGRNRRDKRGEGNGFWCVGRGGEKGRWGGEESRERGWGIRGKER
jgi:hypothetical protein